jgi:putative ABC transport system ATP-binding protein
MNDVVDVRELVKVHAPGSPTEVRALDAISFTIERGSYVAIVGESGSGKSSLLHVLGGLDRPTAGSALVDGIDVASAPRDALKRLRAERIGFVFQGFNLIPSLDALENVLLPARYAGVPAARARKRAHTLLAELGLSERLHHRPQQLSGGQQQRVAIARALINAPALVLADEPTGELDARTGTTILNLFDRIHRERGQTLVVVTHNEAVWSRAQRVIRLADGRIVA